VSGVVQINQQPTDVILRKIGQFVTYLGKVVSLLQDGNKLIGIRVLQVKILFLAGGYNPTAKTKNDQTCFGSHGVDVGLKVKR
jgi:hypothetical protein